MGKQQGKPLKPVQRGADGKLKSGTPNPGGLTSEQRQARDALNRWLCDDPQIEAGKAAYLQLLRGDDENPPNPVIVKDFMDRVAGKVKEHVELSGDAERPLAGLSADAIIAALKGKS
jgi:hypothetical protein